MAKRSNGEGTIYWDKKAKRYRIQFTDLDNRRRSLSAKTYPEAQRILRESITARDAGLLAKPKSKIETLGVFLDKWHESQSQTNWEPKTSENTALDINRYIKPEIGNIKLSSLTPEIISQAYAKIKSKHNLSDHSLHRIHRLLKTALKSAVRLRKIIINPMDCVDAPRIRKAKIKVLEISDIQKILQSLGGLPGMWSSLWHITLLTGLRQGEILGLTWDNVNFENSTISINQQLQRQTGKGLVLKRLKTDIDTRFIYLDEVSVQALKRWRQEQIELRLKLEGWNKQNFVFTNSVGNPLEPRRMTRKWAELLNLNGIAHLKLHGARHSFATLAIKNGLDIKTVSHYLGHTDIKTTISIYQHITDSSLIAAAEKISGLISQGA